MPVTSPTPDYSLPAILPRATLEQMIIERTIADAQFRQELLANPVATLGTFFGKPLPEDLDVRVYVEDANTFYYVSSNTDPSVGAFNTQVGVAPPIMSPRENFVGRLNYLLSDTDANPADLESLEQAMQSADAAAAEASNEARNADVEAALAGQEAEDSEIAYAELLAASTLRPDDPDLAAALGNAQIAMQTAFRVATLTASTASNLRAASTRLDDAATDADEAYEAAVRAAFQQEFASDAVAALNRFLNLETPFSSFTTIYDTDPIEENLPQDGPSPEGICFTHLVETTGQVLYLVLPYTTNRSLFMGPYSISFDGTSSYIQVPRSVSMTAHDLLTVEVWAWVDTFRTGYQDVLLSTLNGAGGWQLEIGGGIPKFTVTLDNTPQVVTPTDDRLRLQTGKWNYFVAVFAGTRDEEQTLSLFINGYKWGQATVSGDITPGGDLLMGRNAAMQPDQSFFMGMIHEARLWGDALTMNVIAANMPSQNQETLPTPLQEALIAHYVFDEGANFTALDDSPNHNDGLMVNAVWQITGLDSPA